MKKKMYLFFILILLLLLMACEKSAENLKFEGDNENWSAKLTVVKAKDKETKEFELQYKGKDPKAIENPEFMVNAHNYSWDNDSIVLDNNGLYKTSAIDTGKETISESDVIDVEVKWNGKVENFTLNKKTILYFRITSLFN